MTRRKFNYIPWLLAGAAVLFIARRIDAVLRPQFWAEDFVFLLEAEARGLGSLFEPRAGYLHIVPRLIAWSCSYLDPFLQPGLFTALSIVVTLVIVRVCLSARHDLPLKPLLALSVVLIPHTGEVYFNPTNLQWIMALGVLVTALKKDPLTPREWVADAGLLLLAGLSGPFCVFAGPLFLLRAMERRTWSSYILLGLCGLAAAAQLWCVAHAAPDTEFSGPFSLSALVANVGFRWGIGAIFGPLIPGVPKFVTIVAGWLIILFAIYAAVAGSARRYACYLIGFTLLLLLASATRKRFDVWQFGDSANGDRYWYLPKVLLIWCLALGTLQVTRRWVRVASFALLACGAIGVARQFVTAPYPDHEWYAKAGDIRQGKAVPIVITPGWSLTYLRTQRILWPYSAPKPPPPPAATPKP